MTIIGHIAKYLTIVESIHVPFNNYSIFNVFTLNYTVLSFVLILNVIKNFIKFIFKCLVATLRNVSYIKRHSAGVYSPRELCNVYVCLLMCLCLSLDLCVIVYIYV